MSCTPLWEVITADRAQKSLARMPERDRARVLRAIDEMAANPFAGDVLRLAGESRGFRRRVGNWRIFFYVYVQNRTVQITDVVRRTTTTYRR